MTLFIHYRATDGEVFGWETSSIPTERDGLEMVSFPCDQVVVDPKTQKIDVDSLTLVKKTAAEVVAAMLPTVRDVQVAIYQELCRTDTFVIVDRPMTDATRAAWAAYRQMLRDLSKRPGAMEMISAWSLAPDGIDLISDLRHRTQK